MAGIRVHGQTIVIPHELEMDFNALISSIPTDRLIEEIDVDSITDFLSNQKLSKSQREDVLRMFTEEELLNHLGPKYKAPTDIRDIPTYRLGNITVAGLYPVLYRKNNKTDTKDTQIGYATMNTDYATMNADTSYDVFLNGPYTFWAPNYETFDFLMRGIVRHWSQE
jgi:hypothetical protein